MQIQKLYMNWSTIKTEVVKSAADFLANPKDEMARRTLEAMLIAEKDAHEAFRVAMQRKDRRFEW